ncbi:sugar phosphate isomerase/epimerase [Paenibacillus sp. IB182496]|uniref:Sugar phosphate isomerase/epimerase n=1 Tax=Paenibacillus sabuli TaxID=2772509 RepID=A0A927GSS5_9BACL|nr:sugar phosphate isomerase/epimerase [Paenibacillus sabuli]MBD2846873.1 sugar phosphate isomerase/epimerase [Paenibacillus sabuli]
MSAIDKRAPETAAGNQMNPLGLMSYIYLEHRAEEMADAMADHGVGRAQVDPRQQGLLDAQGEWNAQQAEAIRSVFAQRGIAIPVLSGYMNLLHPDPARREANVLAMERLLRLAPAFGAEAVATETGSLHPTNQWAYHPDNASEAAWEALCAVCERLGRVAADHGVTLLLEGYVDNVLARPEQASALMARLPERGLGLVLDPFNYLTRDDLAAQGEALGRIFDQVGPRAVIAHAKDTVYTAKGIDTPRPGAGDVDWAQVAGLLAERMPEMPLYLEHTKPEEVGSALDYIRDSYDKAAAGRAKQRGDGQ